MTDHHAPASPLSFVSSTFNYDPQSPPSKSSAHSPVIRADQQLQKSHSDHQSATQSFIHQYYNRTTPYQPSMAAVYASSDSNPLQIIDSNTPRSTNNSDNRNAGLFSSYSNASSNALSSFSNASTNALSTFSYASSDAASTTPSTPPTLHAAPAQANKSPSSYPLATALQQFNPENIPQDLIPVFSLIHAHGLKSYMEGYIWKRIAINPDGKVATGPDSRRQQYFASLIGSLMTLWSVESDDFSKSQSDKIDPVKAAPQYINISDCHVEWHQAVDPHELLGSDADNDLPCDSVIVLNTGGCNRILIQAAGDYAQRQRLGHRWMAAIRLSTFEITHLHEMLTGTMFQRTPPFLQSLQTKKRSSGITNLITRAGRVEGYLMARIMGTSQWTKYWVVINRKGDKKAATFAQIQFFAEKKAKKPSLIMTGVLSAYMVYPGKASLVDMATLFRVVGDISGAQIANQPCNHVLLTASSTADMARWLVGIFDAFRLYGRDPTAKEHPQALNFNSRDPKSLFFGFPVGYYRDRLFLETNMIDDSDAVFEEHGSRRLITERLAAKVEDMLARGLIDEYEPPGSPSSEQGDEKLYLDRRRANSEPLLQSPNPNKVTSTPTTDENKGTQTGDTPPLVDTGSTEMPTLPSLPDSHWENSTVNSPVADKVQDGQGNGLESGSCSARSTMTTSDTSGSSAPRQSFNTECSTVSTVSNPCTPMSEARKVPLQPKTPSVTSPMIPEAPSNSPSSKNATPEKLIRDATEGTISPSSVLATPPRHEGSAGSANDFLATPPHYAGSASPANSVMVTPPRHEGLESPENNKTDESEDLNLLSTKDVSESLEYANEDVLLALQAVQMLSISNEQQSLPNSDTANPEESVIHFRGRKFIPRKVISVDSDSESESRHAVKEGASKIPTKSSNESLKKRAQRSSAGSKSPPRSARKQYPKAKTPRRVFESSGESGDELDVGGSARLSSSGEDWSDEDLFKAKGKGREQTRRPLPPKVAQAKKAVVPGRYDVVGSNAMTTNVQLADHFVMDSSRPQSSSVAEIVDMYEKPRRYSYDQLSSTEAPNLRQQDTQVNLSKPRPLFARRDGSSNGSNRSSMHSQASFVAPYPQIHQATYGAGPGSSISQRPARASPHGSPQLQALANPYVGSATASQAQRGGSYMPDNVHFRPSAKAMEFHARETGGPLIQMRPKPGPPSAGLVGAISARERQREQLRYTSPQSSAAEQAAREREVQFEMEKQRYLEIQRIQAAGLMPMMPGGQIPIPSVMPGATLPPVSPPLMQTMNRQPMSPFLYMDPQQAQVQDPQTQAMMIAFMQYQQAQIAQQQAQNWQVLQVAHGQQPVDPMVAAAAAAAAANPMMNPYMYMGFPPQAQVAATNAPTNVQTIPAVTGQNGP